MVTCKDYDSRKKFALEMPHRIAEEETRLDRLRFSDEEMSHICGTVRRRTCVWGCENPHDITEHERDSPKINAWCTLMKTKLPVLPFFEEPT
jgi:hypothetical protein